MKAHNKGNNMSETFTTFRDKDNQSAQHFLLAAIAHAGGVAATNLSMPLGVVMTVNGVEVPFSNTLEDIYNRISKQAEEKYKIDVEDSSQSEAVYTIRQLRNMSLQEIAELIVYQGD